MLDVDFREFLFLRLSEKGYEQRSDREFCWYTEDEMDRKAPPLAARRARLQAPPRLFGQSQRDCMKKGRGVVFRYSSRYEKALPNRSL